MSCPLVQFVNMVKRDHENTPVGFTWFTSTVSSTAHPSYTGFSFDIVTHSYRKAAKRDISPDQSFPAFDRDGGTADF